MFVFGRESDPDLESKRLGDLLGEKAADCVPVRAADELSAEPAVGQGVVAQLGPRILARTLCLEQLDRAGARECFLQGERLVDAGKPGRVRNDISNPDLVLGEPGPVARDGCFELKESAFDQEKETDGDEPLCPREDNLERVVVPTLPGGLVCDPAPEVDDQLTVAHYREGRADLAALGEVALELLSNRLEAGCRQSGYGLRSHRRHGVSS